MAGTVFPGNNVDEEIEHVALRQCCRNVATLKCPSLVVFRMDPSTHCQFRNEDVASLCEENWRLGGDHLDFWIRFHDFFDPCERKLVYLEVMCVGFKVVDSLLPICG